jgi:hypothetical protein
LGVSRQGEFKNTIKIFLQKVHVENFFQNFDKNFDDSFPSTFFVFGRFSMRGVQKHDKKNIEKINLTLVLFRTLTHPPTTGVPEKKIWRPLGAHMPHAVACGMSTDGPQPTQGAPKKKRKAGRLFFGIGIAFLFLVFFFFFLFFWAPLVLYVVS